MTIYAIIPAAGSGSRAGFLENKLLRRVGGAPVLQRTAAAFAANAQIAGIAVCVNERDREAVRAMLAPLENVLLTEGGETRTASVRNALEALAALPCPPDYVLIHDGARPFITQKIIDDCIATVRQFGSAVCALPCTDTAVRAESGFIRETVPREGLYTLQTPQGFAFPALLAAYRKIADGDAFTDDSGVFRRYAAPPRLFRGDPANKKLTFPEDFAVEEFRTGVGVDTHAFGAERDHIVLGGVRIPFSAGLRAHSDGDVLCHAVMDALLSAAGLPDIGHYFPDTDPQYAGADSLALLAKVRGILAGHGARIANVSASIVAEKPRLAPHIPQMKQNIARALGIANGAVGIAAGTNEGLGYLGRGEGVAVIANALIRMVGSAEVPYAPK